MISHLKQYGVAFLGAIFAFLIFGSLVGLFLDATQPSLVAGSTVTVSATVTNSISCSVSTTTTAFGTLTSSAVATSTPNVSSTMACANDSAGCVLSIKDAGDGANGGLFVSPNLIPSPNAAFNATATLVAGTAGFGIQATTTSVGSGATFTVGANYVYNGNIAGKITTSTITLVSTSATSSGREVVVSHLAAISASTPGGSYTDTITYSCTAN